MMHAVSARIAEIEQRVTGAPAKPALPPAPAFDAELDQALGGRSFSSAPLGGAPLGWGAPMGMVPPWGAVGSAGFVGAGIKGGPVPPAAGHFAPLFQAAGSRYGVDPALLAAVAWTESGFNPGATSPAGAIGLMQIMPETARHLGVDPRDPAQAIDGAARYLRQQLDAFGDVRLALAAYNAGPGAVHNHGGIPPYPETQAYVVKVLDHLQTLGGPR